MEIDFLPIVPHEFQAEIYSETVQHIKTSREPAYIYASVSAGKTIMMAMICKRAQKMAIAAGRQQMRILCLARTGELVEQNAAEMWNMKVMNSIFSASVGIKSLKYPVIVGSEGTIARALDYEMKNSIFDLIMIDECHQLDDEKDDGQYMQIINTFLERNPSLKIIGYTGSPWRGQEPINGRFWKKEIYKIDMWQLVELGFVCPPVFGFGHDDVQYKLDDVQLSSRDGLTDIDKKQLAEMQKTILADGTTTQKIMLEVMALAESRNCVLITCAGSKHIAECCAVLPEGTYATITEKTRYAERKKIKLGCEDGTIKYVLQIGCWTVGVNIPPIDTIVILRKIGSLTLLTQLIGRGIRKLKPWHVERGLSKNDCLVLDYAGTMDSIGHLFNDPLIESAQLAKAEKNNTLIQCPRCDTNNSAFARRCIGKDTKSIEKDGRCGFFWSSKVCEKCGTENDHVVRSCRECDAQLIDPNENLSGTHYKEADLKAVVNFSMSLSKNKESIMVKYELSNGETATEIFTPKSENPVARKIWHNEFVVKHAHKGWHSRIFGKTAMQIMANKAIFSVPTKITHRVNAKGRSIIGKKIFLSEKE